MVRDVFEDAALMRARRERLVGRSAIAELTAVKETDRAAKAAAKGRSRNGAVKAAHPVRSEKSPARAASAKGLRRR